MGTDKRTDDMGWQEVPRGNQAWWTENPMAYDWYNEIALLHRLRALVAPLVPEAIIPE